MTALQLPLLTGNWLTITKTLLHATNHGCVWTFKAAGFFNFIVGNVFDSIYSTRCEIFYTSKDLKNILNRLNIKTIERNLIPVFHGM